MSDEELEPLLREYKLSLRRENQSKDFGHDEIEYKCLLIVNESGAELTLYIYPAWPEVCIISTSSIIIKPNKKYLHREKNIFKFKLVAKFADIYKKELLAGKWLGDKLIKVSELLDCVEGNLTDFPSEERIYLREINLKDELTNT